MSQIKLFSDAVLTADVM